MFSKNNTIILWAKRHLATQVAIVLLIISAFNLAPASFGATSVTRSDTLTTATVSVAAAHTIVFSLVGGETVAAGESMSIDFHEDEAGFVVDGAALTTSDLSFNDGTSRTIFRVGAGAPSCTGSTGANDLAVGVDDVNGIITLKACTAYTVSAANPTLTIRIGTSAGGTNRITNPTLAGSYAIDVSPAFGTCATWAGCRIVTSIVAGSFAAVTATVTGGSSGTNSNSNTNSDGHVGGSVSVATHSPTPPPSTNTSVNSNPVVISGVSISNITNVSAQISWNTNRPATGTINYGLTTSYGSSVSSSMLSSFRTLTLTGLRPDIIYNFGICASDAAGVSGCSGNSTFRTLLVADTIAPIIAGIQTLDITTTSAKILWNTNEVANSFVDFGLSAGPAYSNTATDATFSNDHEVALTGLTPNRTYNFRVRSADPSGNESFTGNLTFRTVSVDSVPPQITNITVTNITINSARVNWATNEPSDSLVDYGQSESFGSSVFSAGLSTTHSLSLSGLNFNRYYVFRIKSKDAYGNVGTSVNQEFQTVSPAAPAISGTWVSAVTFTSATVSWNTSTATTSRLEYGTALPYALSQTDSSFSTTHRLSLFDLEPGKIYNFRIIAQDIYEQFGESTNQTFTTLVDNIPPANITSLRATPGDRRVSLAWANPSDADFAGVRVLRSRAQIPLNQNDGTIIYSGLDSSFLDTGLTNGQTYYYAVFAFDRVPNFSSGAVAQVIPSKKPLINCGNGSCDVDEDAESCPVDCVVLQNEGVIEQVQVLSVSGRINLGTISGSGSRTFKVYPNMGVILSVNTAQIKKPLASMLVSMNSTLYNFRPTANGFESVINAPNKLGQVTFSIVANAVDGSKTVLPGTLNVVGLARVDGDGKNGQTPLIGAKVRALNERNGSLVEWAGAGFNQANPQVTNANGSFGFVLPVGKYQLEMTKAGYITYNTFSFEISADHVISEVWVVQPDFVPLKKLISEKPDKIVQGVINNAHVVNGLAQALVKETQHSQQIKQKAEHVALPASVATAAVSTVGVVFEASAAAPLLFSIYSWLAHPLLLLSRRTRRKLGTVYNSITQTPLDLAIVRLVDAKSSKIIKTMVTDKLGRYLFLVDPGEYKLLASKNGFTFPAGYDAGAYSEVPAQDIYRGGVIKIEENDASIALSIPIDPTNMPVKTAYLTLKKYLRKTQSLFSLLSILVSLVVVAMYPGLTNLGLFVLNIGIYLVFRRLVTPVTPKNFGVVYDQVTKKPVRSTIVRIFETKFNKLLETQLTDIRGRYAFLVGSNNYYLTFEKTGYSQKQFGPFEISREYGADSAEVTQDVDLIPVTSALEKPSVLGL